MTKAQQLSHWKNLTQLLQDARQGHSIDRRHAADLADELAPHFPSFGYTLDRISRRMQG
jgi:hypothetical protein